MLHCICDHPVIAGHSGHCSVKVSEGSCYMLVLHVTNIAFTEELDNLLCTIMKKDSIIKKLI